MCVFVFVEETAGGATALHDGVVHVCVHAHSTLGICAASLGHVLL